MVITESSWLGAEPRKLSGCPDCDAYAMVREYLATYHECGHRT